MASEIAKNEEIPSHYLAKILQRLVKYGYVQSFKGRKGGFRITDSALNSSIIEIVEKIEGPVISLKCITGLKNCSEENPCPFHEEWMELRKRIYKLLTSKTVEEVATEYSATLQKLK